MLTPPPGSVPNSGESTLVLFDLRIPGVADRLHRERAAWQERSDIEALDGDHFVLIVRPGISSREAA